MASAGETLEFIPINIAVLTVSDTRTEHTDTSGRLLAEQLRAAGHRLAEKVILPDNLYQIRALVSRWIADAAVQAVIVTGGTGLTDRDRTPEAITPLLDKIIDGFGEVFRAASQQEIGSSTVQSRVMAGIANATFIFCVPGSTHACQVAWDAILKDQLDSRHKPCNFVQLLPRLRRE